MRKEDICFEDFCTLLLDRVNSSFSSNGVTGSVLVKDIVKGNDSVKQVMCFDGGCEVSPVIYLDTIYDRLDHEDLDAIVESVCEMLLNGGKTIEKSDVLDRLTHEGVKDNLTFRLINKEMNKKYLENKIYRDFLDLAVIYQVCVSVGDDKGRVVITKELAEKLDYSEEELFSMAMTNTPRLYPARDSSLLETLEGMLPFDDTDSMPDPFRVLSNKEKIYGASVLLYPGMVEKLYREYGCKYVIPSSLHEVLIVDHNADPMNYLQMVREVNDTVLEAEDILSNSVYEITEEGLLIAATAA